MNLSDYLKISATLFGECAGCDDCNACRIATLIEQVWESGKRSGAASSVERKAEVTTITEWDYAPQFDDLVSFAIKNSPDGHFATKSAAQTYVRNQLEAAYEWAGSRPKVQRRLDWGLFMKTWIRNNLERLPPTRVQGGLFNQPSSRPLAQSRLQTERELTFQQSQTLSDRNGPH